jgi:hypothetical protein
MIVHWPIKMMMMMMLKVVVVVVDVHQSQGRKSIAETGGVPPFPPPLPTPPLPSLLFPSLIASDIYSERKFLF